MKEKHQIDKPVVKPNKKPRIVEAEPDAPIMVVDEKTFDKLFDIPNSLNT